MRFLSILTIGLLGLSLSACAPMMFEDHASVGVENEYTDSIDAEANALETYAEDEEIAEEEGEVAEDSAENALDWTGIYQGVLPCASCSGIETELILEDDLTYSRTVHYIGEQEEKTVDGQFSWISDTLIRLDDAADGSVYFIGEGFVQMRGQNGEVADSPLADEYILRKQN